MASPGTIMPRSPCEASAGWTKIAGVPVEAKVAAILRPTWPDLPMPLTTTRPLQAESRSTASVKLPSSVAESARKPAASAAKTAWATATSDGLSSWRAAVISLLVWAAAGGRSTETRRAPAMRS